MKNIASYFLFDVETGGLDPTKTSLLSLYGIFLDKDLNILHTVDYFLVPDDGIYHLDKAALNVNKINVVEHMKTAVLYSVAQKELIHLFNVYTDFGKFKMLPVGHNMRIDILFFIQHLMKGDRELFETYMSHGYLDTKSNAQLLKMAGLIPEKVQTALNSLAKYFDVKIDNPNNQSFHTAEYDSKITLETLKKQIELIKKV
jgi:DNA polymerase III alpha subunit (gram-positive type)